MQPLINSTCRPDYFQLYNSCMHHSYRELNSDSTIRLVSDGKCVDISNYGTSDGSNIW